MAPVKLNIIDLKLVVFLLRQRLFQAGVCVLTLGVMTIGSVQAGVVTFEQTPGGSTPTDNSVLSTKYTVDDVEIEFSVFVGGGAALEQPVFERVGAQADELAADSGFSFGTQGSAVFDTAANTFGPQLGDWFLRFGDGRSLHTLVIDYTNLGSTPVTGASGEIWDIDARFFSGNASNNGEERWLVTAFDDSGGILESIESPLGLDPNDPLLDTLDGKPWEFKFTGLTGGNGNGISQIRISYTGTIASSTVGLAFNNFSPVVVPEPSTLSAFCIAAIGLFMRRRR